MIRELILRSIHAAGSGHPGGSLSCVDMLDTVYKIKSPDDIVILSKGHAVPALYATWVKYGLMTEKEAMSLRKLGSKAQGHPSREWTPECFASTGSLGQGIAVAVGAALALKDTGHQVYCILGDGDLAEGITTEACRLAAYWGLHNLIILVDWNRMQSDSHSVILPVNPLQESLAWGMDTDVINGHNRGAIEDMIATHWRSEEKRPLFLICKTRKGKGVSFMENNPNWHGSVTMSDNDLEKALEVLCE